MTVRTGEMLMRAGAMLRPCIARPDFSPSTAIWVPLQHHVHVHATAAFNLG